ncbi:protein NETWORKED 2A-like [Rhodamnia argentea]|uniref:Protein NETWORKED 2A-like n=1 Tax=Rhodamnia argentea TaxID=178133 RepID=A0A8B8P0U5_9MYRT|nr:protein NETWORKED 2A-like [Rhodamnia argentea]
MLQRAASNAYSWWWASHIRTKQSKWLEQSLQDIEDKVQSTLKIIDGDGDSFAKRAEMYYKQRPELKTLVEDTYRAYRALAERYDLLSRELQSANRKIATAFPEEVQFDVDDYDDEQSFASSFSEKPSGSDLSDAAKRRIPKVPKLPAKEFRSPSTMTSRKAQLKNLAAVKTLAPASGLTKAEALEEIDRLQKGILALQTEKEFVKSSFERGRERYWEIENQVMEMQGKVCSLQDEFGIGTIIEDNEARTLMATMALKSCKEALSKMQEQQELSAEEAREEQERIRKVYERLKSLKGEFLSEESITKDNLEEENSACASPKSRSSVQQDDESSLDDQKLKAVLYSDSKCSITMSELAERIDELVEKVINLESAVSSQTSLVRRLKSETDGLHTHIRTLEDEKETLMEGSENMNSRITELEKEMRRIKTLRQNVNDQNQNLLSHFTEASSNIDHLSEKLQNVKMDEEDESDGTLFHEMRTTGTNAKQGKEIEDDEAQQVSDDRKDAEAKRCEIKDNVPTLHDPNKAVEEEMYVCSGPASEFDVMSERPQESVQHDKEENQDLFTEPQDSQDGGEDHPDWRQMFLTGAEDREKFLLGEYTSVLRSYKDVRKKLNEVEKDNRDGLFELAMQIRDLRNDNVSKDEEITALRKKLGTLNGKPDGAEDIAASEDKASNQENPQESIPGGSSSQESSPLSLQKKKQPLYKLLLQHNFQGFMKNPSTREAETRASKAPAVSTMEEKFRVEIDELLEENIEFWLRFSTSIHQVQTFQTSFRDLQVELSKLLDDKKQDSSANHQSLKSEGRPIYRHLREIQTELKLWLEHNVLLKDELESRCSALCRLQDEITRVSDPGSAARDPSLNEYQAAKFQGEVLNMKQENNKVADELNAGLDRVKKLKAEIEKTIARLDEYLGISTSKSHQSHRSRIPLRSFLFGVKLKKQKQPSIFACVNPAMQKEYSDLGGGVLPS